MYIIHAHKQINDKAVFFRKLTTQPNPLNGAAITPPANSTDEVLYVYGRNVAMAVNRGKRASYDLKIHPEEYLCF